MAKRTVKSTKKSCDKLWSELVRAGGHCERCGATPEESQLHAHHVYGRNNHRLRWARENGVCLCARCHRWTHDNPVPYAEWFKDHRLEDYYWLGRENRNGLVKRNLQDYLELETSLQNQLLAMKEKNNAEPSRESTEEGNPDPPMESGAQARHP